MVLSPSGIESLRVFLAGFVALFVLTGIGNGSTYKMIPAIFRGEGEAGGAEGEPRRGAGGRAAVRGGHRDRRRGRRARRPVGINLAFRQAFLTAKSGHRRFVSFLAFYVVCVVVTWAVYLRRPAGRARPAATAGRWPTQ